jgi:hypothetical protein
LLAEFQTALKRSARLLIVGYSFRDDHINEAIRKWVSGRPDRKIVVLDPREPARSFGPDQPFGALLFAALRPKDGPTRLVHLAQEATRESLNAAISACAKV